MIYRITDLNGIFLRDDFTHDPGTEIALDATPAQGLYAPRWNGEEWEESLSTEEIADLTTTTPTEPTEAERIVELENQLTDLQLAMVEIFEGVL